MKEFLGTDFLLDTETARMLYHNHAETLPIIDYHCHLSPEEIAENRQFRSITELWLGGDHYKWRAMRACGVDERFITGDATDEEKFMKWAEVVPQTMRNPLYHWTHMELRSAFGIDEVLNPESARRIYEQCNEMLRNPYFRAQGLMSLYNVETVCTTDDPVDSLCFHRVLRTERELGSVVQSGTFRTKMFPAWRPDKALAIGGGDGYLEYLGHLRKAADVDIARYDDWIEALQRRHDFFASQGCRVADHGVGRFPWRRASHAELRNIFDKVLTGKTVTADEQEAFLTEGLLVLCGMNAEKDWVQQFHFGPLRNVNSRAWKKLGPDTGFDTIGDAGGADRVAKFLDALDSEERLAKTILYNINPADNAWVAAMIANFQDGKTAGKMQWGAGWWFNDQLHGMKEQLNMLSLQGLLGKFVGMLTDSRSFVSYPRHEYFRRLLCRLIGRDVEEGLLPVAEMARIEKMVVDICYGNAKRYFNFDAYCEVCDKGNRCNVRER